MSKSKGNVVNPLEVAEIYGTDAVRMSLIVGATAGNDPIISEDKIRGYRNFTTKIWNASRFVLMEYKKTEVKPKFTAADRKNIREMEAAKDKVAKLIEKYDFNHAAETAYHYFWHTFADKVIEGSKSRMKPEEPSDAGIASRQVFDEADLSRRVFDEADAAAARETLIKILVGSLKMIHPFMPFVTEEVWKNIPKEAKKRDLLLIEPW
jgi:valyl-tRNA synthetase